MAGPETFNPAVLKPSMKTSGGDLKPSLVTSNYSGGTPGAGDLKPSLLKSDGDLKESLLDGSSLKPSLGLSRSVADDFNRADGTLGPLWQTYGATTWGVVSNQAATTSAGGGRAWHITPVTSASQYAEAARTVYVDPNTTGILLYGSEDGANGYLFAVKNNGLLAYRIYRMTGGTFTQIGAAVSATLPGLPFTMRAEVVGNVMVGKVNGTEVISRDISAVDYSANRLVGIYSDDVGNRIDDFLGGDL